MAMHHDLCDVVNISKAARSRLSKHAGWQCTKAIAERLQWHADPEPRVAGKMPKVELYTTMERIGWHHQRAIVEQSVDGMEMIAGAVFTESSPESTEIEFHLAYKIPGISAAPAVVFDAGAKGSNLYLALICR